ncbi:hypothetical protein AM1H77_11450 [Apilactobacillus micheneri]
MAFLDIMLILCLILNMLFSAGGNFNLHELIRIYAYIISNVCLIMFLIIQVSVFFYVNSFKTITIFNSLLLIFEFFLCMIGTLIMPTFICHLCYTILLSLPKLKQ